MSAEPGRVFEGRPRRLTWARALALSGGPFDAPGWPDKNLHTDPEAARTAGLSEVVVSGTQWEGYLVGLLVELFGLDWMRHGHLDIKIPRSVKIGETIRPRVRLDGREGTEGAVRFTLGIWCENQDAQQVMVGTASCLVPDTVAKATRPRSEC
jgi:acyl dehydratase